MEQGFRTGLEVMAERLSHRSLSTGSGSLDALIGGVEPGGFHLFYGARDSGVDHLIHTLLVNSLGESGRAVYLNCGNYKRVKTTLDLRLLTRLMKARGMDPIYSLGRILVVPAFSREQQMESVRKAGVLVERMEDVRLVVVHNIAGLFSGELAGPEDGRIPLLQRVVWEASRACRVKGVVLAATCRPRRMSGIKATVPEGGRYLEHVAGIMVYLRKRGDQHYATLVKHPSRPPARISYCFDNGGGDGLGRITRSFRRQFEEELRELEASYVKGLRDVKLQEAFNGLVEVWGSEQGAMSVSHVPTVLDLMHLTAILDNRKRINEMAARLEEIRVRLEEMAGPVSEPGG
jgi:RecA/RadA recombinase